MNAQHKGLRPTINRPALRAVSGKRVKRIAAALVLAGVMVQPAVAQTGTVGTPPVYSYRVALPVVCK